MIRLCTLLLSFLTSCSNHGQLNYLTELPEKLSENSGITSYDNQAAWFVEDNGNGDNIYKVDFKGKIVQQFEVKNAKNHDWEDLTKDENGNLYIGDFGNNQNDRLNLVIYKLPNPELEKGDKIKAEKIRFKYPEQKEFPPRRGLMLYDSEAFFHFKNHLYIVSKNRANPFTGEAMIYRIPDEKGTYDAEFMGSITTCADWDSCQITSADISADGKTVVLLGYGKIWVLSDFDANEFANGQIREIDLGIRTQLESVCFKNDATLLLSDEVRDNQGGNLYTYTLE